jgi:hypothetical protein
MSERRFYQPYRPVEPAIFEGEIERLTLLSVHLLLQQKVKSNIYTFVAVINTIVI